MIILKLIVSIIVVSFFTTTPSGNSFIESYYRVKDDSLNLYIDKTSHSGRLEGFSSLYAITEIFYYLDKYRYKALNGTYEKIQHFNFQKTTSNIHNNCIPSPDNLTLAFVGDIMWIGKANHNYVSDKLLKHLENFDVIIGNLETPIDRNRGVPCLLPDYLTYNSNPSLIEAFSKPNDDRNLFSVLSIANNHTLDRGEEGIINTMKLLDELGIAHTGVYPKNSSGKKYKVIEEKGISIGIYSATYGINFHDKSELKQIEVNMIDEVESCDNQEVYFGEISDILCAMNHEGVDLKVVYLHWSHEFELYPDIFLTKLARGVVLAGADIVIGSHPHIFQPFEIVYLNGYNSAEFDEINDSPYTLHFTDRFSTPRKALVYYSLGNFVSRMYTPSCNLGAIASINVYRKPGSSSVDWGMQNVEYVYNKAPFFPWRDHSLMLYAEYEDQHLNEDTKTSSQVKKEIKFMMNHISSVN